MANLQQKKLLAVASALGISDISNMQGTTRCIYDELPDTANQTEFNFFRNVSSRTFPQTNVTSNRFEVQESLLIEAIAVYGRANNSAPVLLDFVGVNNTAQNSLIDIVIGNKRVMKDNLVTGPSVAQSNNSKGTSDNGVYYLAPTVGITIPPQVEFEVQVRFQAAPASADIDFIGVALYGTGVLLNLNQPL
jgi:hypothetical protein